MIRQGLVSNSSSSSFVIKGYAVDDIDIVKLQEKLTEKFPELKECIGEDKDYINYKFTDALLKHGIFITDDEEYTHHNLFLGKVIQELSEDDPYLSDEEISLSDKDLKEYKDILQELTDDKIECKVFIGTRSC